MKKVILVCGIIALSILFTTLTFAQAKYPTRAVSLVCCNAPGGGLDFAVQLFKPKLEKVLGQPLILDYRAGAGGIAGSLYVKDLKPDGYTLMAATISTLVLPQLTKKAATYNMEDFTAVCNLTAIPMLFCVKEDSPYKTMQDFIRAAKTKKMTFASPGTYYNAHILMEALCKEAGIQMTHIPQTGTAAGMTAVMGGHVDMLSAASSGFAGPGKLRILATAEEKRLDDYPDVPTLKELGYPLVIEALDSLWAPKGVSKEIVHVLFESCKSAYAQNKADMDKVAKTGEQRVFILPAEELKKKYQYQYEFYKKILGEMGVGKQ